MIAIYLHGMLGRKFGKLWKLEVSSAAEAVRAIDVNLDGRLKEYWGHKGRDKKYRIKLGDYAINDESEIRAPLGKINEIHIVPVVKGASSGWGKIIVGAVILIAAIYTQQYWAVEGASKMMFAMGTAAVGMGASLVLGGIVQLLTPVPNMNQNAGNNADNIGSRIFEGNSTAIVQGDSVPIVYGRMLVSPMPVSISISNVSMQITKNSETGGVSTIGAPGGSYQYVSPRYPVINAEVPIFGMPGWDPKLPGPG